MLEKKVSSILSAVNEQVRDNEYVVIKNEDILPFVDKKLEFTGEEIKDAIDQLNEREFIKLKYSDETTYCLTVLPKGRTYKEENKEIEQLQIMQVQNNKKLIRSVARASAFWAFVGAFLATLLFNFLTR